MSRDCEGRIDNTTARSWFYFTFEGFPVGTKVTFIIKRIRIFWYFVKFQVLQSYFSS
jgi:hypothetical protein